MSDELTTGEISVLGRLVDASNATLLGEIENVDGVIKVIYKPIAGERPLWDFPEGDLALREVAAYLVSEALSFGIVPETVLREGPFGLGSVQRWIDTDEEIDIVTIAQSENPQILKMALLDVLINNTDRKFGHILPVSEDEIYGCDHGLTFHTEDKLRTVLWQFAGSPVPDHLLINLQTFSSNIESFDLNTYLSDEDLAALAERTIKLLADPVFPFPSEEWPSVPWPPF
jgi:uncharacterized repeat protein (TIGR03843 family)